MTNPKPVLLSSLTLFNYTAMISDLYFYSSGISQIDLLSIYIYIYIYIYTILAETKFNMYFI